ncbi:hypothetical protein [Paraburkholderia strydomiana]
MQNTKKKLWVQVWGALIVAFGTSVVIVASVKNPSKADSEIHLIQMTTDMDSALTAGGVVDSVYSNAKFGGALLIKNIKAESWVPSLPETYEVLLLVRGWKRKDSTMKEGILLCKNGMLARIDTTPSIDASHGTPRSVYGFAMSFSLRIQKEC